MLTCERLDHSETRENYYYPGSFGKCLTEEGEILNRWTEYYSELYNHKANGDPSVLDCPKQTKRMTTPSFTQKWRLQ